MWQVYLDMNHYAAALSHCRNPFQRDQVYLVQVLIIYLDTAITFSSLHKTSIFTLLYVDKLEFLFQSCDDDWWVTSILVYKSFVLQADAAFAAKEYFIAASFYAKVILVLLFVPHDNVYTIYVVLFPLRLSITPWL